MQNTTCLSPGLVSEDRRQRKNSVCLTSSGRVESGGQQARGQVEAELMKQRVAASHMALVVKNPPAKAEDARDVGSIPGSRRCTGEGHGNALQYSSLENPMDSGAWWPAVQGVTKSRKHSMQRLGVIEHSPCAILL